MKRWTRNRKAPGVPSGKAAPTVSASLISWASTSSVTPWRSGTSARIRSIMVLTDIGALISHRFKSHRMRQRFAASSIGVFVGNPASRLRALRTASRSLMLNGSMVAGAAGYTAVAGMLTVSNSSPYTWIAAEAAPVSLLKNSRTASSRSCTTSAWVRPSSETLLMVAEVPTGMKDGYRREVREVSTVGIQSWRARFRCAFRRRTSSAIFAPRVPR
ncbi:MAG: hypothetical protein BWY76_02458 [bacterium ADurb.Bin429]|nr:MAG: hypothetical protein BWY76_02458 [bacterium ADurb.Bin429]